MVPRWIQACIYWKKSVMWWHHFQASVFSMIISLFHGSTWSDLYVKETVFISRHLLQSSILTSGAHDWFEKNWRVCLSEENFCSPSLLKVPIYSTELVTLTFVWKVPFKSWLSNYPPEDCPPQKKISPWIWVRV